MSKHSSAFKQSVVEFYLSGGESVASTGRHFGVDHGTVRIWVASYRVHGFDGLARKFSHYTADFKLSVLRRMWEDGLSHRQVAAVFDIRNRSCLADWERRYERGGIEALASRRKGKPRSMPEPPAPDEPQALPSDETRSREELLAELSYLRMENAFLKKLKALTQEQSPLKKRKPFRR
jgi:transposase